MHSIIHRRRTLHRFQIILPLVCLEVAHATLHPTRGPLILRTVRAIPLSCRSHFVGERMVLHQHRRTLRKESNHALYQLRPFPLPRTNVKHLQAISTKEYLSGIQFFHKLIIGLPSTAGTISKTSMLIKGIKRAQAHPPTPQVTHHPGGPFRMQFQPLAKSTTHSTPHARTIPCSSWAF